MTPSTSTNETGIGLAASYLAYHLYNHLLFARTVEPAALLSFNRQVPPDTSTPTNQFGFGHQYPTTWGRVVFPSSFFILHSVVLLFCFCVYR